MSHTASLNPASPATSDARSKVVRDPSSQPDRREDSTGTSRSIISDADSHATGEETSADGASVSLPPSPLCPSDGSDSGQGTQAPSRRRRGQNDEMHQSSPGWQNHGDPTFYQIHYGRSAPVHDSEPKQPSRGVPGLDIVAEDGVSSLPRADRNSTGLGTGRRRRRRRRNTPTRDSASEVAGGPLRRYSLRSGEPAEPVRDSEDQRSGAQFRRAMASVRRALREAQDAVRFQTALEQRRTFSRAVASTDNLRDARDATRPQMSSERRSVSLPAGSSVRRATRQGREATRRQRISELRRLQIPLPEQSQLLDVVGTCWLHCYEDCGQLARSSREVANSRRLRHWNPVNT